MSDPRGAESPPAASADPSPPTPTSGVSLTLSEAAASCRVHRATLRRALDAKRFPHAHQVDGVWRIPISDLQGAGFHLSLLGSGPAVARTAERDSDDEGERERLQREIVDLRDALQHERDAHARTQDLFAQAMRALSPAPVAEQAPDAPQPVTASRRRWWQR